MKEIHPSFGTKYKSEKLGQHILIDDTVLNKILDAACIKETDLILEVGPGTGVLTSELAKKASKVIAVEKDKDAIVYLNSLFRSERILIVEGDILKFNVEDYIKGRYKVVANIPYYLTANLIRNFLDRENKPDVMVLMVQKEVAERICSKVPNMNILAISVQFYGTPEIIDIVSRNSFRPRPRVESAIIKISKKPKSDNIASKDFFQIVKIGFSNPRKKLLNNLVSGNLADKEMVLNVFFSLGFKEGIRAQELSIEDWISVYKLLKGK